MKNMIFLPFLLRIGELNLHFWICRLTLGGESSWWGLNRPLIIHLGHGAWHLESVKMVDVQTKNKNFHLSILISLGNMVYHLHPDEIMQNLK
jgi:hypothetical protein